MVGTEILRDGRVDTNGPWIGETLARHGYEPILRLIVEDDRESIAAAIRRAMDAAELTVVSGGLGPTFDDLTREGAALALGLGLTREPSEAERLLGIYRRRGLEMPGAVARMADLLEGALFLRNRVGSAAGQYLAGPPALALVPGVPSEMEAMVLEEILPRVKKARKADRIGERRVLKIAGLFESQVEERIEQAREGREGLNWTILASPGEITLILRGAEVGPLDEAVQALRAALGDSIFTEREEGIESTVGRALSRSGLKLAVAESCTGGMLGSMITSVPGSSAFFLGGCIAYDDHVKEILAGVPAEILQEEGAVSAGTAAALARGIRGRLGADLALSLTGVAGPGGGTADKPVGLVFAGLAAPWGEAGRELRLGADRPAIRLRACRAALDLLRREMIRAGRWDPS